MNLFRGAGVCPRGMGMFRRMRYRPNFFVVTKWQLPQGQFELEVRVKLGHQSRPTRSPMTTSSCTPT